MADEERPTNGGGFDDWLEEEPGPDTDPYAALAADDDAEAEISEWMAFTEGSSDPSATPEAASVSSGDSTSVESGPDATPAGEPDTEPQTPASSASSSEDDEHEDDEQDDPDEGSSEPPGTSGEPTDVGSFDDEPTEELVIAAPVDGPSEAAVPATSVEVAEFDGGGRPDTEEIPIITGSPEVEDAAAAGGDDGGDVAAPADDDADRHLDDVISTADEDDHGFAPDPVSDDEAPDDVIPTAAADGDRFAPDPVSDDEVPDDVADGVGEGLEVDDTGEMPVLPADAASSDADDSGALPPVTQDGDVGAFAGGEDDTGELDPVPGAPAAGAAAAAVFDLDEADTGEHPSQPFDLSQDDYLATATREHAGLAAAIAEAETSETEQVALAAPIPGLETTVVGFDDVVEAEGHTKARARASGDLLARVVTGVILIAAVGVSLFYRPALVALATVVFVIGAGEFYTALRRSGRQPIALFGFLGILGASIGGFVWGAIAIPTSFLLVAALLLLFYAVVPGKPEPMANLALTVTVMVWAGLGTYAMMIIDSDDFRPLVIGVVLTVALMDIAQYFVGRGLGRHPLSPWVSPKKTVEGLVGGVIVALTLGALLHFVPPFELTSGLAVGAAVAILSPLGDLAMSAAKRALGIKDMGSILPGHGGFLDRIDGLLFVIPAVWAIFLWAGLI